MLVLKEEIKEKINEEKRKNIRIGAGENGEVLESKVAHFVRLLHSLVNSLTIDCSAPDFVKALR